jgi:ribosomal protein S18 acetylase RimI-like enzyme
VVVVTHDGRKGWINRLGVRAAYQRRGIGRELIRASEALIHEKGLTIAAALVEHENEASLGLFKSEGFQVHDIYYLTKRDRPDV